MRIKRAGLLIALLGTAITLTSIISSCKSSQCIRNKIKVEDSYSANVRSQHHDNYIGPSSAINGGLGIFTTLTGIYLIRRREQQEKPIK